MDQPPTPALRRPVDLPDASEPFPESDPLLLARILAEIDERGPITFARFMELAAYDPEFGYYATRVVRAGRAGDFITAPEIHPVFGRTIARALDEMWRALDRPVPFLVREYGAGGGALAVALLTGLRADGSPLAEAVRYAPVELNPHRLADLCERLAAAGWAGALEPIEHPAAGCALANEFLDALPVHRVIVRQGRLRELLVGRDDGRLVEIAGTLSTSALAERLSAESVTLADGQAAEICLGYDAWAADVSATIGRGFVLAVDYGYPAAELYAPSRLGGTLLAYSRHRVHGDPFAAVGRQDLTAHVDFTAVSAALEASGWRTLGLTSQTEFLVGAGAASVAETIRLEARSVEELLALRSALGRLLDPRATGGFRVLVAARGELPHASLASLSFHGPRRRALTRPFTAR